MLIGIFGVIGGALNGLNLLIVVASIIFGVLLMQWRISRAMIDFASIERRMPSEVFAGRPARIRYQVQNQHRFRPLWLLRIEDRWEMLHTSTRPESTTAQITQTSTDNPRQSPVSKAVQAKRLWHLLVSWFASLQRSTQNKVPSLLRSGVGYVAPRQMTTTFIDLTIDRRGQIRIGPWRTSSLAPFALSTASRDQTSQATVVDIYPRLLTLQRSWRSRLPTRLGSVAAKAQRQGIADDVFFGLREYRRGDSRKHIHWRTTARLGQPAVRQFEQQRRFDLVLLVDAYESTWLTPVSNPSDKRDRDSNELESTPVIAERTDKRMSSIDDPVETAISLAATLAVELVGGMAALSVVAIAGTQTGAVAAGSSQEGLRRTLKMLAKSQPTAQPDLYAALERSLELARHRPDLVVISPRSMTAALADSGESLLRQWQRRSSVTWIDVTSRDANAWIASDDFDKLVA
ncbi:MAG: DUF58 domain-containing protein [Planctomycetota bacterium]